MSQQTIPVPFQPTLPFDTEPPATCAPSYTDADRANDQALCQAFLHQWMAGFGHGHAPRTRIRFATFRAAADRLAGQGTPDTSTTDQPE